ncbi:uncharacterized protein [Hetaerina americana]|uniref:uncharacterized protein isoform X2 n=1 Tax=Hetaerina americana TaxID=62018 RepID=UPI003A7F4E18
MVIQRGTLESWRLPSETRIPHRHQLIVTDVPGENDTTELHAHLPFNHQEIPPRQILRSGSLLPSNNEAETGSQVCRTFSMTPMKKIKLEPQEWVEWNALNLRQATLAALPANCAVGNGSSSSFHGKLIADKSENGPIAAVRALDLLRQNLQKVINQEIDLVISRYLEKFFQPAVENIKDNLGPESVTQDMLRKVCRQVLEEAKMMYSPMSNSHIASESQALLKAGHLKVEKNRIHKLNIPKISKIEATTQSSKRKSQPQKLSSPEHECAKKKQKCSSVAVCSKVSSSPTQSAKPSSASNLHVMLSSTLNQSGSQKLSLPTSVASNSSSVNSSQTAVICNSNKSKGKEVMPAAMFPKWDGAKWAASRIVSQTLFVMGARANKALGFGQMRGRLYIKHPELFKYSGDQEDKEWLTRNHLMPPTGGKAYLMIVEDIRELAETEEYKNNPNLLLDEIHGFEVPDFMLRKIRCYVNSLKLDEFSMSSASGKLNNGSKGKVQQNHSKKLPPPVIKNVSCQYDNKKRKEEPKSAEVVSPVKSILETKLRGEKSPLVSPSLVQTSIASPPTSNSCTVASVSSSTNENKITLKSLLESKTSLLSLGDKQLPGK